jgi:hypothetical protein
MGEYLRGIALVLVILALIWVLLASFISTDAEGNIPPPGTPVVEEQALPTCQDYLPVEEYNRVMMWLQHLPDMLEGGELGEAQWRCILDPLRIQDLDRAIVAACEAGADFDTAVFTSLKAYMKPCDLTLFKE